MDMTRKVRDCLQLILPFLLGFFLSSIIVVGQENEESNYIGRKLLRSARDNEKVRVELLSEGSVRSLTDRSVRNVENGSAKNSGSTVDGVKFGSANAETENAIHIVNTSSLKKPIGRILVDETGTISSSRKELVEETKPENDESKVRTGHSTTESNYQSNEAEDHLEDRIVAKGEDRSLRIVVSRSNFDIPTACFGMPEGDPKESACLTKCHQLPGTGEVIPGWWQWEPFCIRDRGKNQTCRDFFQCLYGCQLLGGDRSVMSESYGGTWVKRAQDASIEKFDGDEKCDMLKCRSYCARQTFDSCRESMEKANCLRVLRLGAGLQLCDVTCGDANRRYGSIGKSVMLLLPQTMLLLLGIIVMS